MNRIKELRRSAKMKQIDLCKILNISQGTLSLWENGKVRPDIDSIKNIAAYFNVSVDYLLGQDDNRQTDNSVRSPFPMFDHADELEQIDIAFFGEYRELTDNDKEVLRDMVKVMRERRKRKQGE